MTRGGPGIRLGRLRLVRAMHGPGTVAHGLPGLSRTGPGSADGPAVSQSAVSPGHARAGKLSIKGRQIHQAVPVPPVSRQPP